MTGKVTATGRISRPIPILLIPTTLTQKTMDWRMMMNKLAIVLLLACGSARAEFYSGNEILQRMQSESLVEQVIAIGFVGGVADAFDSILFCPPIGATVGQARDIARRYLLLNPGLRHRAAAGLVVDALAEAWPCEKKRGNRL